MTATRHPTRQAVLECVGTDWQTTQAIFRAWLGRNDDDLSRSVRDAMRRDVFYVLDSLLVMRVVEKRQVSDVKAEWRLRPTFPEDHFTSTVDGAAAYERHRAGHAGPW